MKTVYEEIAAERDRQERLRDAGKFSATCATTGEHEMTDPECLAVLGEEVGEVFEAWDSVIIGIRLARAMGRVSRAVSEGIEGNNERGRTELRKELVQTAAVAVAWIERLDSK